MPLHNVGLIPAGFLGTIVIKIAHCKCVKKVVFETLSIGLREQCECAMNSLGPT